MSQELKIIVAKREVNSKPVQHCNDCDLLLVDPLLVEDEEPLVHPEQGRLRHLRAALRFHVGNLK